MGLDITVYKRLAKVENPQLDEDGCVLDWENEWQTDDSMRWSESHWLGRAEGVEFDTVYTFEESFGFSCGGYMRYNWWRQKLSEFADGTSFQELINFSDCEGVIGPVVSGKLATDFAKHAQRAEEYAATLENGEYWIEKYKEWQEAFEMAEEGGAVDFH